MTEQESFAVVTQDGPILTVRLDNQAHLNAINLAMSQALEAAVARLGDDEELRALIITGTGRYFCSGLDISEGAQAERRAFEGVAATAHLGRRKYRQRHHDLHDEIERVEKPVILAAQGPCLGLGLEMAASCDFRFCTPEAHFGLPEVPRLGVVAGSGGTSRLTRLIGPHWSKWIGMAGRNVDAETALRIGLVHEIHPADEFMARVDEFAREIAALPEEAVALAKLTIDICTAEDREARHIERIANSSLSARLPTDQERRRRMG